MIEAAGTGILIAAFLLASGVGLVAIDAEYRRNPSGWAAPVAAAATIFAAWLLLNGHPLSALLLLSVPIFFWSVDQSRRARRGGGDEAPKRFAGLRLDKLGCWGTAGLLGLIALAMLLQAL